MLKEKKLSTEKETLIGRERMKIIRDGMVARKVKTPKKRFRLEKVLQIQKLRT